MRGPMTNAPATPSRTSSGPGTPRIVEGDTTRNGSAIASSPRTTQPIATARTLGDRKRGPIPGTLIALSPSSAPHAGAIICARRDRFQRPSAVRAVWSATCAVARSDIDISADIESDAPIPGRYSMLSFGLAVAATEDLPPELIPDRPHTHDALADAIEQGEIFTRLW